MKTVHLFRHGQSQGQTGEGPWLDPVLTELGQQQARNLREFFTGRTFDHIIVSPLTRARRTFELSKAESRDVRFDSRLVECTLDRGPGFDYREILPYETPEYGRPDEADMWTAPAGKRVSSFFEFVRSLPGKEIALFAHCGLFYVMRLYAVGKPIEGEPSFTAREAALLMDNVGHSVVEVGDRQGEDSLVTWDENVQSTRTGDQVRV